MPYTPELQELIKTVEKTRPARVEKKRAGQEFPAMSLQEREAILKYHPDFKEDGRTEILVGPNKGYRIAKEMVNLLHAKSRVDPDAIDLSRADFETDVLVVG
ncbi:MAG: succinate dehydrogenase/fumarate reductase flavoprotein subunit, partial [Candidatus Aminicenantes bacterium]|nr:succinate dehydrogenase/fumarate reductase flavoprotein subunit [Candidatus Aminicenantes bacterium]